MDWEEIKNKKNEAIYSYALSTGEISPVGYSTQEALNYRSSADAATNVLIASAAAYGFYKVANMPLHQRLDDFTRRFTPFHPLAGTSLLQKQTLTDILAKVDKPTGQIDFIHKPITHQDFYTLTDRANRLTGKFNPKKTTATLAEVAMEAARRTEESLWKIPRTFALSSILSTQVYKEGEYFIPGKDAARFSRYFSEAFPSAKKTLSEARLYEEGVTYSKGKLYLGNLEKGGHQKLISDKVGIVAREFFEKKSNSHFKYTTWPSQALQRVFGLRPNFFTTFRVSALPYPKTDLKPFLKDLSNLSLENKKEGIQKSLRSLRSGTVGVRAVAQEATRRYMTLLDNPLEALEALTGGKEFPKSARFWKKAGLKNLLGTGGEYNMPASQMIKRHMTRALPLMVGAYALWQLGDAAARLAPDNTTPGQGGLLGPVAELGKEVDLGYSRLSEATGLTNLRESQEDLAGKSSTRLTSILGNATAAGLAAWAGGKVFSSVSKKPIPPIKLPSVVKGRSGLKVISKTMSGAKGLGWAGFAAGLLAQAVFVPGALGSRDRPEELEAEYSGEKDVVLRKGRFWEAGTTSFWGDKPSGIVPNWYQRLMTPSKETTLYNEGDQFNPIRKFAKNLADPYWLEKQHYMDMPAPVTGPDDSLSQVWAATIGKILKPVRYMHSNEMSLGGTPDQVQKIISSGRGEEYSLPIKGGIPRDKAISPYSTEAQLGEGIYRNITERPGLLGYIASGIKEKLTGSADWFDEKGQLESFSSITSPTKSFWDQELGGGLLTTEFIRRIFPKDRHQIEQTNPLANTMPDWLTGPGEKGKDFLHGIPQNKLTMPWFRLPGVGYAERFPELEGLPTSDYPDVYKHKILSDVAPYSEDAKLYRIRSREAYKQGMLSERESSLFENTEEVLKDRKKRKDFMDSNPDNFLGRYWKNISTMAQSSPLETIIPFSPANKFGGDLDAVKEYKRSQILKDFAPWHEPIESYLKPTVSSINQMLLGYNKPESVEKREMIESYFDKLKYIKNNMLSNVAWAADDPESAKEFFVRSKQTMTGLNPYGSVGQIFKAIPARERDYFANFSQETDPGKRAEILDMTSPAMDRVYKAQWEKRDAIEAVEQERFGAEEKMELLQRHMATEGLPATKSLWSEYLKQKQDSNNKQRATSYPSFVRNKLLSEYFSSEASLPAPDHLAWNPNVDLDDYKLKIIQNEAEDIHDYGMWGNREQEMGRKPYLDILPWNKQLENKEAVRQQIQNMLQSHGMRSIEIYLENLPGGSKDIIEADIQHDRTAEIQNMVRNMGMSR